MTTEILPVTAPISLSAWTHCIFIGCASFEERCLATTFRLDAHACFARSVIFVSREYEKRGRTSEYLEKLTMALRSKSTIEPKVLGFRIDHPLSSLTEFEDYCKSWHNDRPFDCVVVDLTCFPRQEMFVLLRILESLSRKPTIRIFVAEPEKYHSDTPEGWLTRGVRSVSTIPGFGGTQPPGQQKLLLTFLGHQQEIERFSIIAKRHQPNKHITVHSDSLSSQSSSSDEIFLPSRKIDGARRLVHGIARKFGQTHSIVVAALCSKFNALGIYKAAVDLKEIQLTHAVPSVYNYNDYSTGIKGVWEVPWRRQVRRIQPNHGEQS